LCANINVKHTNVFLLKICNINIVCNRKEAQIYRYEITRHVIWKKKPEGHRCCYASNCKCPTAAGRPAARQHGRGPGAARRDGARARKGTVTLPAELLGLLLPDTLAQRSGVRGPLPQEYVGWHAEMESFTGSLLPLLPASRQQRN